MHTSEEEDCDDLPSITVNSSANNSSAFVMPSAEELAEQRARDVERDRQLDELHLRAQRDERVAELRHSDSEGELALAAAALRVHDTPRAARAAPPAAALWAALAPRLPPPAADLPPAAAPAVDALAAALAACPGPWPDDELLWGAALLCVAAAARDSRARRPAARTLHALLDDCATPAQVSQLTAVLLEALPEARVRLQLGDALRSGAGGGADRAARALCEAALLALLCREQAAGQPAGSEQAAGQPAGSERAAGQPAGSEQAAGQPAGSERAAGQPAGSEQAAGQPAGSERAAGQPAGSEQAAGQPAGSEQAAGQPAGLERVARAAGAWRACDADARDLCVQLAGRLLAGAGAGQGQGEARARLLAHLAPPPATASDTHRPDRLKALVGASKLQLLFSAKNSVTRQPRAQRVTSTSTSQKMELENKS